MSLRTEIIEVILTDSPAVVSDTADDIIALFRERLASARDEIRAVVLDAIQDGLDHGHTPHHYDVPDTDEHTDAIMDLLMTRTVDAEAASLVADLFDTEA